MYWTAKKRLVRSSGYEGDRLKSSIDRTILIHYLGNCSFRCATANSSNVRATGTAWQKGQRPQETYGCTAPWDYW